MFLLDLFEDDLTTLDQLLSDFESDTVEYKTPKVHKDTHQYKAYRPRNIKGVDHSGNWPQYIRSEKHLRSVLNEVYGSPQLTLEKCIKLFTDHYYKIDEMIVVDLPVKQLEKFKEYDRELVNDWTGKMTKEEHAELMKDIQQNGIQNYGTLSIYEKGGAQYSALLDEGNHRLGIALTLGIPVMPIKFNYGVRK